MALEYRQFVDPREGQDFLPRTIDDLFANYFRAKEAAQRQGMMERQIAGEEGAQLASQGFLNRQVTPDVMRQAQATAPQGPMQPGQAPLENPLVGFVRAHLERKKEAQAMGMREKEAGIIKTLSQAKAASAVGHGAAGITPEQIAAMQSGDVDKIGAAFPDGVPLQALRFGTAFKNSQEIAAEREDMRRDKRAREKTSIVDRFNADVSVKKAQQSIDAANTIRGLVESGNPIAAASIPTFMARASGEVGNLSEADKRPFGGSQAITSRLQAAATQAASGRLTKENAVFIAQLAGIMEKRADKNIDSLAKTRSKQYSAASEFLKEDDIFRSLRPESQNAPVSEDNATQGIALTGAKAARLAELRAKAAKVRR